MVRLRHDGVPIAAGSRVSTAVWAPRASACARVALGRLVPALSVAAAFYLALLAWLVLWVVGPWTLAGWHPVVVTGGSMRPGLEPGDVVLIDDVPDDVLPGTVVSYRDPTRPGRLVTHRLHAVGGDGALRTKGDANAVPDSTPVAGEDVVGVGRLLVPLLGRPVIWLQEGDLPTFAAWVAATAGAGVLAVAPIRRRRRDCSPRSTGDIQHG